MNTNPTTNAPKENCPSHLFMGLSCSSFVPAPAKSFVIPHSSFRIPHSRRSGFTLIEMSTAMSVMLVLAVALVVLMQQHVQFMEMFRRQSFLTAEAPKIGDMLGRIFNNADHYFVYATKDDALAAGQPVLTGGRAVRLFFKPPNQQTQERVIAVETTSNTTALRFYSWQTDGTLTSWTISDRIAGADFRADEGILSVTLDGPNGEQVTYSGGAR